MLTVLLIAAAQAAPLSLRIESLDTNFISLLQAPWGMSCDAPVQIAHPR